MSMRMVPIGNIFAKLKRHLRDLARGLKREAVFNSQGAGTQLDQSVMEKLSDPLMHIIRNCMDHGIEAPAEREYMKKPRHGTIT